VILRNKNGLAYYQFEHLAAFPEIQHGIFARDGGHSQAPFDCLNVSFSVGDDREHVGRNRQLVAGCMGGQDLVLPTRSTGTRCGSLTDCPRLRRFRARPRSRWAMRW